MIKIARVSPASQGADRTYRFDFPDGSSQFVDAASKQDALELYYERRIARLQSTLIKMIPAAPLPTIGAALRNGGIHSAERGEHGFMDYIDTAHAMGFQAETHTRGEMTYLRIAPTVAGLSKLKGQIDKTVRP